MRHIIMISQVNVITLVPIFIQLMHGQGTCVMIEKINDEDLIDSLVSIN